MATIESFQAQRPRLLAIAYRMLGSMAEAEDVMQEAWLRARAADTASVHSDKGWLSTVVVRLCLDQLKSARAQREAYVGPWLPEPVQTQEPVDSESISLAFLVLLESLTPAERAVYLLHEVFDYTHAEVGAMVHKEEATCRQLHHRACERIRERRPRFAPSRTDHLRLLTAFGHAMSSGDLQAMREILAPDATLWADGGGNAAGAARRPIHGAEPIARFLTGLVKRFPPSPGQTMEVIEVNGWPALVGRDAGRVNAIITIETEGAAIVAVRNVVNPDKLRLVPLD
jgi:RNA polymerase sigma-70 factor (ECF subfamily)